MTTRIGKRHLVIPDCQVKPGVPTDHLTWIGNYVADKKPDTVIQIGDFADMPSLSSYDKGKLDFEGRRYKKDIASVHEAMEKLMKPIRKVKGYNPRLVLTLGNHEERIERAIQEDSKLDGMLSIEDLEYKEAGWETHDFLEIVTIDGFEYTHYFTSGVRGLPVSSAAAILRERHSSGVMGHVQTTDIAFHKKSGHIGIISGCCYLHEEKYLGPQMQGKAQRRQIIMLNEVHDGIADPMLVSLKFLKANYS